MSDPHPQPPPADQGRGPANDAILDERLTRDFGFDSDEWQARARRASRPGVPLGSMGQYELTLELGRGAQGVVYKAVQPGTGRVVALKRLGAGLPPAERDIEHMRREVRAATRLSHPNIVTVYATETIDGHAALVMEYVQGIAIDRWADEQRGKAEKSRAGTTPLLRCFLGVCDGVEHAHRRGVIHRDIKPSNVLVTADGTPKVLDFGIALLTDHLKAQTTATGFAGTPAYAAPEQVLGTRERDDTRCDVYALGAVLRRMVTGEELFGPGASMAQIVDVARSGTRIPASRSNPLLPRDLDWIILKAMAPEPDGRYQSVGALADDVRRFLEGRTIAAHPPTLRYQAGRFVARHTIACSLAGIAVAAVLTLSALSTMQAISLSKRGEELAGALQAERAATATAVVARVHAEEQQRVASAERDRQQAIAAYLLNVADGVAENSAGRLNVPVEDLGNWFEGAQGALDRVEDPVVRARLHLGLSEMRRASDDVKKARWHAQQALSLLPASGQERLRLRALIRLCANTNSQVRDGEAAIAFMREAGLSEEPIAVEAWRQLGTCYQRARRTDDALKALEDAASVATKLRLGKEVEAQIVSDEAVVLWRGGRVDEAMSAGERVLALLTPEESAGSEAARKAAIAMGEVSFAKGRYEDAERYFGSASAWSRASPGDGHIGTRNAMRWHARALHELGRYEEAAALYERLLQLVPPGHEAADVGVWWVRFRYGATLLGLGQTQEARRQLCMAVSKGLDRGYKPPSGELAQMVDRAERALQATNLRFTPELKKQLGDMDWLVDFVGGKLAAGAGQSPAEEPVEH